VGAIKERVEIDGQVDPAEGVMTPLRWGRKALKSPEFPSRDDSINGRHRIPNKTLYSGYMHIAPSSGDTLDEPLFERSYRMILLQASQMNIRK